MVYIFKNMKLNIFAYTFIIAAYHRIHIYGKTLKKELYIWHFKSQAMLLEAELIYITFNLFFLTIYNFSSILLLICTDVTRIFWAALHFLRKWFDDCGLPQNRNIFLWRQIATYSNTLNKYFCYFYTITVKFLYGFVFIHTSGMCEIICVYTKMYLKL